MAAPSRRNSGFEATTTSPVGLISFDVVAGADRHGRLGDNRREAAEVRRDFACGSVDIRKIGMAIAAPRWSADSNEDRVRFRYCLLQVNGEIEPTGGRVGRDQLIEPRFENGDFAALEGCDPVDVLVDAAASADGSPAGGLGERRSRLPRSPSASIDARGSNIACVSIQTFRIYLASIADAAR
jgi:hypothetical protein